MITPFTDGDVDYGAADLFARHLVDGGIHGLVVCGTTGEGSSLSPYEKARLLDTVTARTPGDLPVFLGLEGTSTQKIIDEVREIGNCPATGYLLPAPSYVRPSQEGVYRHFMAIEAAVKRPVVIYDIPARTGVHMSIDTIARLAGNGDFPAIKACGLSTEHLQGLLGVPGLKVMCGDDIWIHQALRLGAHGAIAASAQVAPRRFLEAYASFESGGAEDGWQAFHILSPLMKLMFDEPNPGPVKAALAIEGWVRNELRLPMTPVTEGLREQIRTRLQDLNLHDRDAHLCPDTSHS